MIETQATIKERKMKKRKKKIKKEVTGYYLNGKTMKTLTRKVI